MCQFREPMSLYDGLGIVLFIVNFVGLISFLNKWTQYNWSRYLPIMEYTMPYGTLQSYSNHRILRQPLWSQRRIAMPFGYTLE